MAEGKPEESLFEAFIRSDPDNADFNRKENEIRENRIDLQYKDMVERKRLSEKAKNINVSINDPARMDLLAEKNTEYLVGARSSGVFLTNDFKGKVPYFARNIILLTAQTGEGKSTIGANLSHKAALQGKRVCYITNEENPGDVYNRITCLIKGIPYQDHTKFSDSDIKMLNSMMKKLSKRIMVIDDNFNGEMGQTTTIEGLQTIFKSLMESLTKYDVIIIDYYQNIDKSIENPGNDGWRIQEQFCKLIDNFKNSYDAPVVLLAQKRPNSENVSFKESIEGRKVVLNVATCAIEVIAKRELLRTDWVIRKSRFSASVGETISTGFDHGKYVEYDSNFQMMVEHRNTQKKVSQSMNRNLKGKKK